MSIERQIQELFIHKGWTLALAESCTGGNIAARLVSLPGASLYFLGSVVAYSNESKINLLQVNPSTIATLGAVSEKTAEEMAQGALCCFKADFALSATGIAGPDGGSVQKPVGTVCFAYTSKGMYHSWKKKFSGSREEIIQKSTEHVLEELFKFANSL